MRFFSSDLSDLRSLWNIGEGGETPTDVTEVFSVDFRYLLLPEGGQLEAVGRSAEFFNSNLRDLRNIGEGGERGDAPIGTAESSDLWDLRSLRNIGEGGETDTGEFFSSNLSGLLLLRNIGEGGETSAEALFIRSESLNVLREKTRELHHTTCIFKYNLIHLTK